MSEYKRLTKHVNGKLVLAKDNASYTEIYYESLLIKEALQRLAELEDKIEAGTLVELPCKCIEELDIIKDGMIFIFYKMCLEQNLRQGVFLEYKSKINEWFKSYLKNKGLQEKGK